MFYIYLGKNGCGKTLKLNNKYEKEEKDKIFFPCASEILSMIDGKQNRNCLGTNGKKWESKSYDNAIIKIIELICKSKINNEESIGSTIKKSKMSQTNSKEISSISLKKFLMMIMRINILNLKTNL